ncbi:hypothetical protein BaRGS_00034941, partial [Batillaria attramentaria]
TPGTKVQADGITPLAYFRLFLTDEVLQLLVDETNRYAQQCADAAPRPFTKYSCMSRSRFEDILQFLHVVDNTFQPAADQPGRDKLFKIRPFLDAFTKACKECYDPKEKIAVDESIMPWKGRLGFKQYIPSKPVKYGIKMYFACESGSGYISRLKIYSGKQGDHVEKDHGGNV